MLRRRELEEYLSDPEVLRTFLQTEDCEEVVMETVVRKRESLLIGQHGPKNIKDVSRDLFAAIRSDTGLPNLGNNREEFASDHPLENTRTCPKCFGDGHRLGIGLAQDLDHLVFAEASLWRGTERKRMNLAWKGSLGTLVSVRDPSGDRRRGHALPGAWKGRQNWTGYGAETQFRSSVRRLSSSDVGRQKVGRFCLPAVNSAKRYSDWNEYDSGLVKQVREFTPSLKKSTGVRTTPEWSS